MKKLSLILITLIIAVTLTSCGNNSEIDLLKGEINELKQIIAQKDNEILEKNQTIEQHENESEKLKQAIAQKSQEIEELNDSVTTLLGFRTANFNCPYYDCDSCFSTCETLYGTRGYRPLGCACYKCKPKGGTFGDRLPDCNCYNCGNGYHKGLMQVGDYRFGMGTVLLQGGEI